MAFAEHAVANIRQISTNLLTGARFLSCTARPLIRSQHSALLIAVPATLVRLLSSWAQVEGTLRLVALSDSVRGQGGKCNVAFLKMRLSGLSRIACPLGGGVSLLKGSHVAVGVGAAGTFTKISSNKYCRLRRTPGWPSLVASSVISGL